MNYRNTLYLTAISAFLAFSHVCGMNPDKNWLEKIEATKTRYNLSDPTITPNVLTQKTSNPDITSKAPAPKDDELTINKRNLLDLLDRLDKQYTANEVGRKSFNRQVTPTFIRKINEDINKEIDDLINIIRTTGSSSFYLNVSDSIKFLENIKQSSNDRPKPLSPDSINELLNIYGTTRAHLSKIASEKPLELSGVELEELEKTINKTTGMSETTAQQLKDAAQKITDKFIRDIEQGKFSQWTLPAIMQALDTELPGEDIFVAPYRQQVTKKVMDVINKIRPEQKEANPLALEQLKQQEQQTKESPQELNIDETLNAIAVKQEIENKLDSIHNKIFYIKQGLFDDFNILLNNIIDLEQYLPGEKGEFIKTDNYKNILSTLNELTEFLLPMSRPKYYYRNNVSSYDYRNDVSLYDYQNDLSGLSKSIQTLTTVLNFDKDNKTTIASMIAEHYKAIELIKNSFINRIKVQNNDYSVLKWIKYFHKSFPPESDDILKQYRPEIIKVIDEKREELEESRKLNAPQVEQEKTEETAKLLEQSSHTITRHILQDIGQKIPIKPYDITKIPYEIKLKSRVTDKDYNTILHAIWGAIGISEVTGGIQSFSYLLSILANDKLTNWLGIDDQDRYNYALEHLLSLSLPLDKDLNVVIQELQDLLNNHPSHKNVITEIINKCQAQITKQERQAKLEELDKEKTRLAQQLKTAQRNLENKVELKETAQEKAQLAQATLARLEQQQKQEKQVELEEIAEEEAMSKEVEVAYDRLQQQRLEAENKKEPEPNQWSITNILMWPLKKIGSILSWLFPWLKFW
jgi:hypothetical protein